MCVCVWEGGRGAGRKNYNNTSQHAIYSHGALRLLPLCFATEAGEISASRTPENAEVRTVADR